MGVGCPHRWFCLFFTSRRDARCRGPNDASETCVAERKVRGGEGFQSQLQGHSGGFVGARQERIFHSAAFVALIHEALAAERVVVGSGAGPAATLRSPPLLAQRLKSAR